MELAKADAELYARSLISRRVSPFSPIHFLKKFQTGVRCVMLDFHMQVLGTFDLNVGSAMQTGLNFTPPKLGNSALAARNRTLDIYSRYEKKNGAGVPQPSKTQAAVLEIDLSQLGKDVFAVVPVIYDDCLDSAENSNSVQDSERIMKNIHSKGDIPAVLHNMKFDCNVYLRENMKPASHKQNDSSSPGKPERQLQSKTRSLSAASITSGQVQSPQVSLYPRHLIDSQDAVRDEIDGVISVDDDQESWLRKKKGRTSKKEQDAMLAKSLASVISGQKGGIEASRTLIISRLIPNQEKM